jgi:hypothetical protein
MKEVEPNEFETVYPVSNRKPKKQKDSSSSEEATGRESTYGGL